MTMRKFLLSLLGGVPFEDEMIATAKLQHAEMRLHQYDSLMEKLKKFDWFEMNSGGGIVAHEKGEPEEPNVSYGTMLTVPYEMIQISFH